MATMGQYKCANARCGTMFSARVADRKRGWARYCCKSCKAVVQEQRTGQYAAYINRRDGYSGEAVCFPSHAEGDVQ